MKTLYNRAFSSVSPLKEPVPNSSDTISLSELRSFQGIILSGGPWNLLQPMLFSTFKLNIQVMLNAEAPIYGICMGHEIIAEANGSLVD